MKIFSMGISTGKYYYSLNLLEFTFFSNFYSLLNIFYVDLYVFAMKSEEGKKRYHRTQNDTKRNSREDTHLSQFYEKIVERTYSMNTMFIYKVGVWYRIFSKLC